MYIYIRMEVLEKKYLQRVFVDERESVYFKNLSTSMAFSLRKMGVGGGLFI